MRNIKINNQEKEFKLSKCFQLCFLDCPAECKFSKKNDSPLINNPIKLCINDDSCFYQRELSISIPIKMEIKTE
jgi:hypothetical protein